MRRERLLISSIAGGPPFTRSITSSSLASVSVAPFAPIVAICPPVVSLSMPSNDFASTAVSPLTNVSSNFCCTAFAFSRMTAACRSCRLLRVVSRKLSMSASPPTIDSVAVICEKVGVPSVHVSPTVKNVAAGFVFSRLYVSPLPVISMNGSACRIGESSTIVSITPCSTMSFESFADSASVRAMWLVSL